MLDKVNQYIQQTQLSSGRENHQIYLFAVDSQLNSNSTKLRAYFFADTVLYKLMHHVLYMMNPQSLKREIS